MRIVHVVQTLGMGGQERLILNLSRELVRRGHEVSVLSLTPGGEIRPEFAPIPVHDVTRKAGFDALIFGRMARTLNEIAPDAVHTHNPSPMFYAVPASRALRIKSNVHTKHGANVYGRKSLRAVRILVRTLSAFVCVSEGTAEVAREKEHVPEKLLHVIPNGIPLVDFNPNAETRARLRRELTIPENAFVVGSVGRLAPEKDYPLLVKAMTPLLGENVRLVLVGDGASRKEIEASIPQSLRPFVTLTGSRRDVGDLLTTFDVFALTSKSEGLPLVIPEAMATKLPIVATAVGGLPSIVPVELGTLAPHGDDAGLTRALRALHEDEPRRKRMGEAAHRYAHERFSLEKMTDAYEALYRQAPAAARAVKR